MMSNNTSNEIKLPHTFSIRLRAVYDTLKSAERKAANLLLEQPELVAVSSISEAARVAGCSEPTLTRLARKLGFTGFSELKAELQSGMQHAAQPMAHTEQSGDPSQLLTAVFRSAMRALTDTLSVLDRTMFEQAVKTISEANRIIFMGAGEAWAVALTAEYRFALAGFNCSTSSESDMQLVAASSLGENDACVIFSYSGRSRAMVAAARRANASGAKVIAITNFPVSPLSKQSDIVLLTAAFDEVIAGDVTSRQLTQVCVLDSLFLAVMSMAGEQKKQIVEHNRRVIQANKQ